MYQEAHVESIVDVYVAKDMEKRLRENAGSKDNIIWKKLQNSGYELVSDEVFARMSDTQAPQGILCVLKRPEHTLQKLLKQESPLLVILENLQDPGNLGTMIRTAEGAGADGIFMSKGTVGIYNPKTIRATMGSLYRMPFLYVENIEEGIRLLQKYDITVYAAHLKGKKYFHEIKYSGGSGFLIGNEGSGLKEKTADAADCYLRIPMEGKLESLNAAIAAALLMYQSRISQQAGVKGKESTD